MPPGLREALFVEQEDCALDHDPEAAMAWLKTIPRQFLPASIQSDAAFAALKDRTDSQALFHSKIAQSPDLPCAKTVPETASS